MAWHTWKRSRCDEIRCSRSSSRRSMGSRSSPCSEKNENHRARRDHMNRPASARAASSGRSGRRVVGQFDLQRALRSLFLVGPRSPAATAIRGGASRCDRSDVRYIVCACCLVTSLVCPRRVSCHVGASGSVEQHSGNQYQFATSGRSTSARSFPTTSHVVSEEAGRIRLYQHASLDQHARLRRRAW